MKKLLLMTSGLFFLFQSSFGQNQASKALTHEIMVKLKKVGAPVISPDGKFIVYSQVETSYNLDEQTTDLWLAPSDGKTSPRRITSSKSGEDNYFWSPSGDKIYFTAKRDGDEAAQLYSLPLNGGEAQRITSISTGVSAARLSSDGRWLAFTSRVYPSAFTDSLSKKMADDKKKIKAKARVYTSFPVRYWDSWLDEKQAHIFALDLSTSSAQPVNLFKNVSLVKSQGFNLGSFSFTPDNKSIVFSIPDLSQSYQYLTLSTSNGNLFSREHNPIELVQNQESIGPSNTVISDEKSNVPIPKTWEIGSTALAFSRNSLSVTYKSFSYIPLSLYVKYFGDPFAEFMFLT